MRALLGWAGFALVVVALLHSCDPGRHAKWTAQVDRIRADQVVREENARYACAQGVEHACE